jgi:hypothetical protein
MTTAECGDNLLTDAARAAKYGAESDRLSALNAELVAALQKIDDACVAMKIGEIGSINPHAVISAALARAQSGKGE